MKIVLVNPPSAVGRSFSDGCYPPRGIWSLGTFVQAELSDVEVCILDGNLIGQEKLRTEMLAAKPDLIGISTHTTFSYPNCLELLALARTEGVPVVMGGIHASCMPQMVAKKQRVDVIYGQGEQALAEYIRWREKGAEEASKSALSNLCWTNAHDSIVTNPPASSSLHLYKLPWPNHQLLNVEPYWLNFQSLDVPARKSYIFFTHEGCKWRDVSGGGCKFCTLPMRNFFPPPESVWDEIRHVVHAYGPPVWFKDYGDCFSGDWDFVAALCKTRPRDLLPGRDYFLDVYIKPGEVRTQEHADLLKEVGVAWAFVGFESGNNRVLRLMRKGSNRRSHETLVRLLAGQGIRMSASYVLGMESEDQSSLEDTLQFARWVKEQMGDFLCLSNAGPVSVLPGSPMWSELKEKLPDAPYFDTDNPEVEQAGLDWLRAFCPSLGSSPEEGLQLLKEVAAQIEDLAPAKNRFGWDT